MARKEERLPAVDTSATTPVKKATKKPGLRKRMGKWFRDMRSELKKVVWPTPKQTVNNTLVALVVMFVAAIVIWGFDSLADAGVNALINLAG